MFKNFCVVLILGAFFSFLFGIANLFIEVEENACRMTYMFQQPQFARVKFEENKQFPNYGLYYYYESRFQKELHAFDFYGAPIIFVPGNAGSYKQARSFASVALRNGEENKSDVHFDYFTIDYNEELSGLYGGYLENQKQFLKLCIARVLQLYKNSPKNQRKVVLIGHSMGGKLAQAMLTDAVAAAHINTIIFIATPLDAPIVQLDASINAFYAETDANLAWQRHAYHVDNGTNVCGATNLMPKPTQPMKNNEILANILLISIGGGNRDLIVHAGYTTSVYSDIHAMTSSIPNVWLSCDHLSAVWCLQLVLVINSFLLSITQLGAHNYIEFNAHKETRLQQALHHFVKPYSRSKMIKYTIKTKGEQVNQWHVESKRVFSKRFPRGLQQTYNQMLPLSKYENFKKLYVEILNADKNGWIYGCRAEVVSNKNVCEKGFSLGHHIQIIPSLKTDRAIAMLDLHNIRKMYPSWTHITLRLLPTKKPLTFNVDIHNPNERSLHVKAPRWFAFKKVYLLNETLQGTAYLKLHLQAIHEPLQTFKLNIEPRACIGANYEVAVKICTPWARGFERFQILTENSNSTSVYINVPKYSPPGYNTTKNPVTVELYLDTACRYSISYQFSIAVTLSRLVQHYYPFLLSHLTAILFIVLKNQILKPRTVRTFKSLKPYTGYFQCTSLYLVAGSRLFKKLLLPLKFLPSMDLVNYPIYMTIIVHGTAIMLSVLASFAVWFVLVLQGDLIEKVAKRIPNLTFAPSSVMLSVMSALPISYAVLAIAIAFGSCSGLALIMTCLFYFLLMTNAYKDLSEELIKDTIKKVATSVRRTLTNEQTNDNETQNNETEEFIEGFEHFPFHVTMFLLTGVLALINVAITLAWYRSGNSLADPSLLPTIVSLACLSLLWQLKAPKYILGSKFLACVLYAGAVATLIYGQETIYRLNYIIAFVYIAILAQELFNRIWCYCLPKNQSTD